MSRSSLFLRPRTVLAAAALSLAGLLWAPAASAATSQTYYVSRHGCAGPYRRQSAPGPWRSPLRRRAADDGLVPALPNARRDRDETTPSPRVCQKKRCVLLPYPDVGASGDGRRERAGAETGERHRLEDVSHC
jgi:hypothetical protein